MSRGYTKEMRKEASRLHLDAISPQLVIDGNKIYLTQVMQGGGEVKVDATGLYNFLKEMFTTDWQTDKPSNNSIVRSK